MPDVTRRPVGTRLVGRRAEFPITPAPDIEGLAWKRPALNGWTTLAQRTAIRAWLVDFFRARQWPRGWEIEEWLQAPHGRSASGLENPLLLVRVWALRDRSDTVLSTIDFDDNALADLALFRGRLGVLAAQIDQDRSTRA